MPKSNFLPVFRYNGQPIEWDRPGVGLYADGSLRVITQRDEGGTVTASCKASEDQATFIVFLEKVAAADHALLTSLAQQPDSQDATNVQLRKVHAWANRLGCYDAADAIRGLLERSPPDTGHRV